MQIENRPALDVIKRFNGPGILIYADPPYPMGTRTLNGQQYRHEMTDEDHKALAAVLHDLRGMVVLSGYRTELYDALYPNWAKATFQTRADSNASRTECLWLSPSVQSLTLNLLEAFA